MPSFRRPRGTEDFLPDEMIIRSYVEGIMRETFESYGFQQVQTPIFEEFALLAARSGEEIREGMFTFVSDDTEYALRPELTAPVCRLVATGELEPFPRPYKVYCIGQCFRYERPQAGRYREFRHASLELIGSSSPMADAEVISVASSILDKLGISDYTLKVGNIGIFRYVLASKGFDYNFQSKIISDIDNVISLREKCETIRGRSNFERDDIEYVKGKIRDLYTFQDEVDYEGEHEIVPQRVLDEASIRRWLDELPLVAEDTYRSIWVKKDVIGEELADLLINISKVRGSKDETLQAAKDLIWNTDAKGAFEELQEVLNWLEHYGVSNYQVVLGVARGLDYYTGTVFEIDYPLLGAQKQICGGGRYDKLVSEFGGPEIQATGFAFGFDRVTEAFKKSDGIVPPQKVHIFVAAVSEDMKAKAVEIAGMLRGRGKRVEVDMLKRGLQDQLGYASGINCDYAVIVGPDELEKESVILRNMRTREQELVAICSLADSVNQSPIESIGGS